MRMRPSVDVIERAFPAGTCLRLVRMDDPQAPPEGTLGTVLGIDDMGQILMAWDNGSSLSLLPEKDLFRVEGGKP